MTLPMGTMPFLLLQVALLVLVFSIGFLVGRDAEVAAAEVAPVELQDPAGSGGAASAAPAAPRGGERAPLTSPRPETPGGGTSPAQAAQSPADRAFLDPASEFTVVVYTAENSEYGRQQAWTVHDYLSGKGYPVVQPRAWKGQVKIFVGAGGRVSDLKDLEAQVRKDPGPDGTQPFYDAYVDKTTRFR